MTLQEGAGGAAALTGLLGLQGASVSSPRTVWPAPTCVLLCSRFVSFPASGDQTIQLSWLLFSSESFHRTVFTQLRFKSWQLPFSNPRFCGESFKFSVLSEFHEYVRLKND